MRSGGLIAMGLAIALAGGRVDAHPRYSRAFMARMGDGIKVFNSAEDKACWDLQVTSLQRECFNNKIQASAARLRHLLKNKLAALPPARRAVLVREQRRWARAADPFCDRYGVEPGTMALVQIDACRFNVNYKRIQDVERFR